MDAHADEHPGREHDRTAYVWMGRADERQPHDKQDGADNEALTNAEREGSHAPSLVQLARGRYLA